MIDQPPGDQVQDFTFALQDAEHAEQAGAEQFAALPFDEAGMDDHVDQPGFILQRQKDDAGGAAQALPVGDEAGAAGRRVVVRAAQLEAET